ADVEGHALPTPGIDLEPHGSECFRSRIRRHTLFLAIASELPSDDIDGIQHRNRFRHLHLLVPNGFAVDADGRLHGEIAQDLQGIEHHSENGFSYVSAVSAEDRAIEKMLHPTGSHQGTVT